MPASSNIQIGIALRGSIKKKGTEKRVYSVQLCFYIYIANKQTVLNTLTLQMQESQAYKKKESRHYLRRKRPKISVFSRNHRCFSDSVTMVESVRLLLVRSRSTTVNQLTYYICFSCHAKLHQIIKSY